MHSEASFAALCGASPVQASSGRTVRHRLNRGGNRQANNALWRIATTRMRRHQPTIAYINKRQAEGKNRREIIRCLKRHIAREIYRLLTNPPQTPSGAHLRCLRQNTPTTLAQAATALQTHPTRLSQLEASTTTTTSPPVTTNGSPPTKPQFDNNRSIEPFYTPGSPTGNSSPPSLPPNFRSASKRPLRDKGTPARSSQVVSAVAAARVPQECPQPRNPTRSTGE